MRDIVHAGSIVAKALCDATTIKTSAGLLIAVIGYFFPGQTMYASFLSCMGLVVLDTITGVISAGKQGHRISSARFARFLVKLLSYSVVVSVVALTTHAIPGTLEVQGFLTSGVIAGIAITEGISVLENIEKLGIKVPFGLDRWLKEREGAPVTKHGPSTSTPQP